MDTMKIGIREFREKLSTYLLESNAPLAITRHGDTIGLFIPARRKRTETERAVFREVSAHWDEVLASKGVDEEEVLADFKRERAAARR